MKAEEIKKLLAEAGAYRTGIASATEVDPAVTDSYTRWLSDGRNAGMGYLENYKDIRRNPALLLSGARSVISSAFNYRWGDCDGPLQWASYALGDDYHDVVRQRLQRVAEKIMLATGAQCHVCVDTAPIHERYWAAKAGLGFIGLNRQLIIPDAGTHFFLGEIITTLELEPDEPLEKDCGNCGRCLRACPGKALDASGLDARRCLSYLTIEHRGELPDGVRLGKHVYGCDVCQEVCPHNAAAPTSEIEEFRPRQSILRLDAEGIMEMTQEEFSAIFRRSAIKRTKISGLQRNAQNIIEHQSPADDATEA